MKRGEVVDLLYETAHELRLQAKDIEAPIHERGKPQEDKMVKLCLKVIGVFGDFK